MSKTAIEWTEQTWNPVAGCTWASAGCDHCYAATMTRRLEAMGQSAYAGLTTAKHFNGKIRTLPDKLDVPLRRKKPTMWFVNSMSDLFHKAVPVEFIVDVFATMWAAQWHTFQVLTKRAEHMASLLSNPRFPWAVGVRAYEHLKVRAPHQTEVLTVEDLQRDVMDNWPLPNVWLGTSVENQEQADKRIPHLLQTPAAVRFLSCEPLLGAVTLPQQAFLPTFKCLHCGWVHSKFEFPFCVGCRKRIYDDHHEFGNTIDWVIAGGESGHGARPCNVAWVRDIVSQCKAAGVPVFVKQMGSVCLDNDGESRCSWPGLTQFKIDGEHCRVLLKDGKGGNWNEWPDDIRVREFPGLTILGSGCSGSNVRRTD